MAFPTVVRRATAVSSTTSATSWSPSYTFSTNTAISAGERVLWLLFVSADGGTTMAMSGMNSSGYRPDSGFNVTGKLFWIETTAAYAAGAVPTELGSLTSNNNEQFSAVLIAVKASGSNSLAFVPAYSTWAGVDIPSANGSSTNSNPAAVSNDSGASQDVLVICSRHGDAQVNATVAPTNYGNLVTINGGGASGASTATAERQITMASAASEDPGTFTSATEQWVTLTVGVFEYSAGYTLTAASGSFTLTGTAATLKAARTLGAGAASFTLSGTAVTLKKGSKLTAGAGSFALTGTSATFPVTRKLAANAATFALTGTTATLKRGLRLTAASGTFALTDTAAALTAGRNLAAAGASFTLSGTAVSFNRGLRLTADAGSVSLTGTAMALRASRLLTASPASFVLTGTAATLSKQSTAQNYTLTAVPGQFVFGGTPATFARVEVYRKHTILRGAGGTVNRVTISPHVARAAISNSGNRTAQSRRR